MSGHLLPINRAQIERFARGQRVPADVVTKDYLLSYLLAGISDVPDLRGLCFKGGTALKKMYFGDYRFSEDLDFTGLGLDVPRGENMDRAMATAVEATQERLMERGRFQLEFDRPPEHGPHPSGQDAFRIRAAFPWQSKPMVRVKVEITYDESVLLSAPMRPLIHGYQSIGETLDNVNIITYSLEEIVVEKLRALRQLQLRLEERGWSRPRARDYYDLWRILRDYSGDLDTADIQRILPAKFAQRGVTYDRIDDFFTDQLTSEAREHWTSNLENFVAHLPDVESVLVV